MSSDLAEIIKTAVSAGVEEALTKLNLTKEYITYSEVKSLYGRKIANEARKSDIIEWFPFKAQGGQISVRCMKKNFTEFLLDRSSFQ